MKEEKSNHFNISVALKILALLGFSLFFLLSLQKGTVHLYVHPRVIPFLVFVSAVMIVIAFLYMRELFSEHRKETRLYPLLFFILPVLMAFLLPPRPLDSNTEIVGDIQLQSDMSTTRGKSTGQGSEIRSEDKTEEPESDLMPTDGVILFDDDNFAQWLAEIYEHTDRYIGKPVELTGFVFKDSDDFSEDEFVPARLMMVCCAADMQTVGLLCRYGGTADLAEDTWVKVTGTIDKTAFNGETIPVIVASAVEETQKPPQDYIYP